MLIKRKKKKEFTDNLEGIKFTHESTALIYTISKESSETLFKVSWSKTDITNYAGHTTYSKEDIIKNIEKGIWKIVY
jgi:hypothetical protein